MRRASVTTTVSLTTERITQHVVQAPRSISHEDVADLVVFLRVAELGSFSKAARLLEITKATASKRLSRLEERLGTRLLLRTTRQVTLTEAGRALFEHSREILPTIESARDSVHAVIDEPVGKLRVNASSMLGSMHLAPLASLFMKQYPRIQVELGLSDQFVDVIKEGWDVVVRMSRYDNSVITARRLARDRFTLTGSPEYFASRGRPQSPRDLESQNHTLLRYTQNPTQQKKWHFEVDGEDFAVSTSDICSCRITEAPSSKLPSVGSASRGSLASSCSKSCVEAL